MSDKEHERKRDGFRWIDNPEEIGEFLFTFDGEKVFYLFQDYPYALSREEKEIFDRENPYWANYFRDRTSFD